MRFRPDSPRLYVANCYPRLNQAKKSGYPLDHDLDSGAYGGSAVIHRWRSAWRHDGILVAELIAGAFDTGTRSLQSDPEGTGAGRNRAFPRSFVIQEDSTARGGVAARGDAMRVFFSQFWSALAADIILLGSSRARADILRFDDKGTPTGGIIPANLCNTAIDELVTNTKQSAIFSGLRTQEFGSVTLPFFGAADAAATVAHFSSTAFGSFAGTSKDPQKNIAPNHWLLIVDGNFTSGTYEPTVSPVPATLKVTINLNGKSLLSDTSTLDVVTHAPSIELVTEFGAVIGIAYGWSSHRRE
jgi:hypothetical protein